MGSEMAMKLMWLLSLVYLQYCLRFGKSNSVLIIALPQYDIDTDELVSWERGGEILPGALAAVEEANDGSLSFNLTLVEANSGQYNLLFSGNVLEVITNLTQKNRVSDIIGIVGVFHPSVLAVLSRFQLPIASLINFDNAAIPNHSHIPGISFDSIHINSR